MAVLSVRYQSVSGGGAPVTFREALFSSLAPDGGLYVPRAIPRLSPATIDDLPGLTLPAIAARLLAPFMPEIGAAEIERLAAEAWDFPIPLVQVEEDLFLLELFHGPTLAFKDVGARFMARVVSRFTERDGRAVTVLTATSGDTGGAVAAGFSGVPRTRAVILYPAGRVSRLQEAQIAGAGGNVTAVRVEGSFDDCQKLVRQALADPALVGRLNLTTANSINLGRLLPQVAYYGWALGQFRLHFPPRGLDPVVVVPSGNFGNLTAAVYARRMGVPIERCVAATNANDVVPQYLARGAFHPRPSVPTLSSAMDVGNPGNLARLDALYGGDVARMRHFITAESVSDDETLDEIRRLYSLASRLIDPHTAVGTAVARRLSRAAFTGRPFIVPATAHPAKFPEALTRAVGAPAPLPPELLALSTRPVRSIALAADYRALTDLLRALPAD